jgi:hypothetical protein
LCALAKCFDGSQDGSATMATDRVRLPIELHVNRTFSPDQFAAMETDDLVSRKLSAQHRCLEQPAYSTEHVLAASLQYYRHHPYCRPIFKING